MNMLPINSEWKRRIKWAEKQRKEQRAATSSKHAAKKILTQVHDKMNSGREE